MLDGSPPLLIPTFAKSNSIEIGDNLISMELRRCPELTPVLQGQKFLAQNSQFVGNFECSSTGLNGKLKPVSSGRAFSIDENDLAEAQLSAYYLPNPEATQAIEVEVVDRIVKSNQVVIQPGGKIEVSPNLVGKHLKVRCIYPRIVVFSKEPITTITVHFVGVWQDESIRYATAEGCEREDSSGTTLKLRFSGELISQVLTCKTGD